jgi:calcium permeable stress-gated cation channel
MATTFGSGYGGHRQDSSTSGAAILAAFIPTFITAVITLGIFLAIRNSFRKFYVPRTFLGTIPEKERTPETSSDGKSFLQDFRRLSDKFVLQHNSLDAYLFLRFFKFIIWICLIGTCITFPILLPINATGGGSASQLDRLSFSNVEKNDHLWAHLVVAWVLFLGVLALIAVERLQLIGVRQAYLLDEKMSVRLSARTVLFLNAPPEACQSENLKEYFGEDAEISWPLRDTGDLDDLVAKRTGTAHALESAEMDLIVAAVKNQKSDRRSGIGEDGELVPKSKRPTKRSPPLVGSKYDPITKSRNEIGELSDRIEKVRNAPGRTFPEHTAIFVAFNSQAAAHRAFQRLRFGPPMPMEDRFLAVTPKEVLWKNLAMPVPNRLSKASVALFFVIAFTIFFSIPVGLIGTLSNAKELADRYEWLEWLNDLPPSVLGLLVGLVPPFLTSWFVSYVSKLFRHIAKLSGEPTVPQAELKVQAWYFVFSVFQVFLVTTFSSGAAAVVAKIAKDPQETPKLLAEALPKASNFYLTYFILQGTASAASSVLNYSDLFEYLFYEYIWDKTPREKFNTYASVKGTPWATWYPKFTNFLVIALAYACVAPLVLGLATIGLFMYYLSYKYQMLYVRQTKIDTKGESYKRALQQMPTGLYLAELCLIGLFGVKKAAIQTTLMIVLLVITAVINFVLDRILRPLELYLGVDVWQEEQQQYAQEDGINENDDSAVHAAAHGRRLGIKKLPHPAPRVLSDVFDSIITKSREQVENWLAETSANEPWPAVPKGEDLEKAYLNPVWTSKVPKLWIPSDHLGVSKQEIEQNAECDISATDEGAEVDDKGKLHWDHRFENVPVFSKPKVI